MATMMQPHGGDPMKRRISKIALTGVLVVIHAAVLISCTCNYEAGKAVPSDTFEMVRTDIQSWLSEAADDTLIISSAEVNETIVNDWDNKKEKFQIVSVRKPDDYKDAGHIPNAMNIYWVDLVKDENMVMLDADKMQILYCYYGHGSMISCTILSLLGYRCKSLDFGMMDWSLDAVVKPPWDREADYEVETEVDLPGGTFPLPRILSEETDAKSIIKEMARKYLGGEGSPIIRSSDVKDIVDKWDLKKAEYQIVDVRSREHYEAGHVPHSIQIPWLRIAEVENLKRLDPGKTIIVCSENGQTGQLATTVLSLLGYKAVNMLFGMMDWNLAYMDASMQWDGEANYPIEK